MMIHVLNLARDRDRRDRMQALLEGSGLDFTFVDAVLGTALSDSDIRAFRHHETLQLGRAEIGCLLSHAKAWRAIAEGDRDWGLVLEDDLHFAPGFPALLKAIEVNQSELCAYRLETFFATVTASRAAEQRCEPYGFYELFTNHGGAAAYILNRRTAEHLWGLRYEMQRAVDTELFDPGRRTIPPLTVYQCFPAPCLQDQFLGAGPSAQFLESRIGSDREDVRAGLDRAEAGLKARLKDRLRPAYRAAYSLWLAPRNRRRVRVGYG